MSKQVFGLIWLFASSVATAASVAVGPGQGVMFYQLTYPGVAGATDVATGRVEVDLNQLRLASGMETGYLNVATAAGWVVRNLPLPTEASYPYHRIGTSFALGVSNGSAVRSGMAAMQLSDQPVANFAEPPSTPVDVVPREMALGGIPDSALQGPPLPPDLTGVSFSLASAAAAAQAGGETRLAIQADHPNLEAARNQCMPMAIANSLQFLKNKKGLVLPHAHQAGLKGDNTLVGQLDTATDRSTSTTDRRDPNAFGTWGLPGKLKYLARNNLGGRIETVHWGVGGSGESESGTRDVSVTENGVTLKSTGKGAVPDLDALIAALGEDQDCEVVYAGFYTDASGTQRIYRHAVDAIGAGKVGGMPFLMVISDLDQGSDTKGAGAAGIEFGWLSNWRMNGAQQIEQVICQKYIPPPTTLTVTERIDPAGHAPFVDAPPKQITVTLDGSMLRLSGSASWLPMTGTLSAGSFSLTSSSVVAGFSNVSNTFSGTLGGGSGNGTISLGTRGELFGTPISWKVELQDAGTAPVPAIRVNGFRQTHRALSSELKRLSVSMAARDGVGQEGDWWVVLADANGLHSLDLATMSWRAGLVATHTGPLVSIDYLALPFELTGSLGPGNYTLYFGFDRIANRTLDMDAVVYDSVELTIE